MPPRFRCKPNAVRLAALMTIAACVGSSVSAQEFSFGRKKYLATPGEVLPLTVNISGFSQRLAGINFTVRISGEDGQHVRLLEATSEVPSNYTFTNYAYTYNTLQRSGVTSGVITGSVQELRGALYQTSKTTLITYPFSTPREFATIYVPIDIEADGRYMVELVSAIDNGVALLGGSNVAGEPVLPAGENVPRGDVATIVVRRNVHPGTTDFTNPENFDGWTFNNPMPTTGDPRPIGESIAGKGLTMRAAVDNSYGFWAWDFNRGAWRTPPADSLLVTDWRISSNVSGTDTPPFRLRVMTDNHVQSSEVLIQDLPENNDSISIVPGTAGRTYRTLAHVPLFAADGYSDDGMNPYFDMMQFGYGKPGARLALEKLTEWYIDPSTLRGRKLAYSQSFAENVDGGWRFTLGNLGGKTVSYSRSRYGLGMTSGGPYEELENNAYSFSYGFWYAAPEVLKVNADSSKWFRIDAMIIGTADLPLWNPMVRLRVYPPNNEYFAMHLFAPVLDPADYHVPRPDLEGKQITMWFQTPPEMDGKPLAMAYDLIHLNAPDDGTDQKPSLFLKWITINQFNAPALAEPEAAQAR